jgi:hypothetical protein
LRIVSATALTGDALLIDNSGLPERRPRHALSRELLRTQRGNNNPYNEDNERVGMAQEFSLI